MIGQSLIYTLVLHMDSWRSTLVLQVVPNKPWKHQKEQYSWASSKWLATGSRIGGPVFEPSCGHFLGRLVTADYSCCCILWCLIPGSKGLSPLDLYLWLWVTGVLMAR